MQVVLTSPLTRALETTVHGWELAGAAAANDTAAAPRIEVVAALAEHDFGGAPCDSGSPAEQLAARFAEYPRAVAAGMQFNSLQPVAAAAREGRGARAQWWPHHESHQQFQQRVAEVAGMLSRRPERVVAVVGHGHFLRALLRWPAAESARARVDVRNAQVIVLQWPRLPAAAVPEATAQAHGLDEQPLSPAGRASEEL